MFNEGATLCSTVCKHVTPTPNCLCSVFLLDLYCLTQFIFDYEDKAGTSSAVILFGTLVQTQFNYDLFSGSC